MNSIYYEVLETKAELEVVTKKWERAVKELERLSKKGQPVVRVSSFDREGAKSQKLTDLEHIKEIGELAEEVRRLNDKKAYLNSSFTEMKKVISNLNRIANNLEMKVFELHYLKGYKFREIADRLMYSLRQIYRTNSALVEKMNLSKNVKRAEVSEQIDNLLSLTSKCR